jgi:peptidoglycan hydrolase-like protein with peptidoglycan-binding domain
VRLRVTLAVAAALALASPAAASNPQHAGLQVALRAYGLYLGPIDGIAGPKTVAAVRAFQRREGLPPTGLPDARTRRALGPLGRPLFGRRSLVRGRFGWDVSVLQFILARRGFYRGALDGYFDAATARAVRRYQRTRRLESDGIVGRRTLAALHRQARVPVVQVAVATSPAGVRQQIDRIARRYGVDVHLVRALAWMESGYRTDLTSSAGAEGVMQIIPATRAFVETVLLRRALPRTPGGNIEAGVVYLRHLLREFRGSERLALAAWFQGPHSVKTRGVYPQSRHFAANVLALRDRL